MGILLTFLKACPLFYQNYSVSKISFRLSLNVIKGQEVLAFARMTMHFFSIGEILTFVRIVVPEKALH